MLSSSSAALRRNNSFFESTPKVQYPTQASDYNLMEEIGRGVSAKVYRAECIPLNNEQVAVKKLDLEDQDPGHLEEIRREVASMSMLSHPNLVMAHCSFVEGQYLWIVMPFCGGGSALNIMKWSHPKVLDETSIATILKEVLKALDYFHRNGNIHRDVKAGNILIDDNGSVKIGDFGVSAASWGSGAKPHATFVGTPCWMAPEVMEQVAGYDWHADIWSLGITVLELCHGHAPFAKYPPMKVLLMTLQNPPPQLEAEQAESGHHFSRALRDFVSICLQKDPSKRPSAAKLLEHKFLKEAKKTDFLIKHLLDGIPTLGDRTAKLNEREKARQAQRAAAVAAGGLSSAPSTEAAEEKRSNAEYLKGVSRWDFDMDAIRAEAAAMTLDEHDKLPTVVEGEALPTGKAPGSGNNSGFNSPRGGQSSGANPATQPSEEKRVEQKGRFTVIDDDDANGAGGMNSAGGSADNLSRSTSVQKGRFTVMDDDGEGGGSVSKTNSSKALQGSSKIIGSSEPAAGTVAAAAKAAIEREMDPPKLKPRKLYDAAEQAGEIAKMLREMHDEMEEQQSRITVLVDDNRWLRKRVLELEATLSQ